MLLCTIAYAKNQCRYSPGMANNCRGSPAIATNSRDTTQRAVPNLAKKLGVDINKAEISLYKVVIALGLVASGAAYALAGI
ncbi:hypothetical protein EV183_002646 [Coemansia sp. RSA 2336]|nr:hypothetical protein EV183_002646 [Coemansia sp. RSA 2336]